MTALQTAKTCGAIAILLPFALASLWVTNTSLYAVGLWNALRRDETSIGLLGGYSATAEKALWSVLLGTQVLLPFAAAAKRFLPVAVVYMVMSAALSFSSAILPVLASSYLVIDDEVGIGISLGSIGCLSLMIGSSFTYMQMPGKTTLPITPAPESTSSNQRPKKITGSRGRQHRTRSRSQGGIV